MNKVTISSNFSRVNGRKVHYLTCGQGKPLVLLHGYLGNARTLSGLIKYSAKHYKVYAPDFPGFGLSEEFPGRPTLDKSSKVITNWIIQEGLKDFVLVGVSMGGTAGVYIAKEIDELIKGYVLVEPYFGPETLLFPGHVLRSLTLLTIFFNRILLSPVGEKLWSSKKLLLFLDQYLNPLQGERNRPIEQKLDILSCATYKTFWHTMDLLLKLDLKNEKGVSNKPTLLVMDPEDESLDYQKTLHGFKKTFPNFREVPIDLTQHYPMEPMTICYIETYYPTLLKLIIDNFKK